MTYIAARLFYPVARYLQLGLTKSHSRIGAVQPELGTLNQL